jgi:hypothetical protein
VKLAAARLALFLCCCACSKPESATEASASASAARTPASAPASAPPAASAAGTPAPSAAGAWTGSYEARQYRIEMSKKEGAVREWAEDKGNSHTGKGSLTVDIAENGTASGSATGPLGELSIAGELDGELLRLRFAPVSSEQAPAFTGVLLAEREGEAFTGRLKASSGDSLIVREALVTLRKKGASAGVRNPARAP